MSSIIDQNEVSIKIEAKPEKIRCSYMITRGENANKTCGKGAIDKDLELCKTHLEMKTKKEEKENNKTSATDYSGRCSYAFKRGEKKGQLCGKKILQSDTFCKTHSEKDKPEPSPDFVLDNSKCSFILKNGSQCKIKMKAETDTYCTRHKNKLEGPDNEEKKPAPKKTIKSKKAKETEGENDSDDKPVVKKSTKTPKEPKEAKPKKTKTSTKKKEKDEILENATDKVKKNIEDHVVDRSDIIEVESEEEDEKPAPKKKIVSKKKIVEESDNEDENMSELSEQE